MRWFGLTLLVLFSAAVFAQNSTTTAAGPTPNTLGGVAVSPRGVASSPALNATSSGVSSGAVPPTPQPASPGLPSFSGTPGSSGLPTPQLSPITTGARPPVVLTQNSIADLQSRLGSLGLFHGPVDGQISATFRASVITFQQSVGIPATGELDATTLALMQSVTGTTASAPTAAPANVLLPAPVSMAATPPPAAGSVGAPPPPFPLAPPPRSSVPTVDPFIQP